METLFLSYIIDQYVPITNNQHNCSITHQFNKGSYLLLYFNSHSKYQLLALLNMRIWKKLRDAISFFDFFSRDVSFLYKENPQYVSLTGGLVSIIIIIIFIVVFFNTALSTFNKEIINYSWTQFQQTTPTSFNTSVDSDFLFAVGITGVSMTKGKRYFDITLQHRHYKPGATPIKTNIALVPCQKESWTSISQQFGQVFDQQGFQEWLCPPSGMVLDLQGKYTSPQFKFYRFSVNKCKDSIDLNRPCIEDSVITSYIASQEFFSFNFYFVNKLLNPGDHEYVSYFLDDLNYFSFSTKIGVNADIFVNTYEIKTDNSIWPITDQQTQNGGYVKQIAQKFNYGIETTTYLKMYIRKASNAIKIQRSFYKVDETLSYIGGLFGAIVSSLIVLKLYNEYLFLLDISSKIYRYNQQETINVNRFNIFVFFLYGIFCLFKKCNIILPIQFLKKYDHTIQQMQKQMDIGVLMRRLEYTEQVQRTVVDKSKLILLQLQKPPTLQAVQEQRQLFLYYYKLKKLLQETPEQQLSSLLNSTQFQKSQNQNHLEETSKNVVFNINAILTSLIQNQQSKVKKKMLKKFCKAMQYLEKYKEQNQQQSKLIMKGFDTELMKFYQKYRQFEQKEKAQVVNFGEDKNFKFEDHFVMLESASDGQQKFNPDSSQVELQQNPLSSLFSSIPLQQFRKTRRSPKKKNNSPKINRKASHYENEEV